MSGLPCPEGTHVGEQVQEAAAASESFLLMPDAFINMGSLFLALDKPKLAIQVRLGSQLVLSMGCVLAYKVCQSLHFSGLESIASNVLLFPLFTACTSKRC